MAKKKTSKQAPAKKTTKKAAKKAVKVSKKKTTKKKASAEPLFDVQTHVLVPKHEILSEEEIQAFFEQYDLQPTSLPTIYINDAAIKSLSPKIGDIIKITRTSHTAGTSVFYRRVAYE